MMEMEPNARIMDVPPAPERVPASGPEASGILVVEAGLGSAALPLIVLALLAGAWWSRRARNGSRVAGESIICPDDISEGTTAESDADWADAPESRVCPLCAARYTSDTLQCEDCAVDLADSWEDVPRDMPRIDETIVRVYRVRHSLEAQVVRHHLAGFGIPCMIVRSSLWDSLGADVYCFESDALTVRRLIGDLLPDAEAQAC